ncbi:Protein of unknown function [Gryllus bimaculatus]|nr:Protein of unknown function [Gryllus bimaculatus]
MWQSACCSLRLWNVSHVTKRVSASPLGPSAFFAMACPPTVPSCARLASPCLASLRCSLRPRACALVHGERSPRPPPLGVRLRRRTARHERSGVASRAFAAVRRSGPARRAVAAPRSPIVTQPCAARRRARCSTPPDVHARAPPSLSNG